MEKQLGCQVRGNQATFYIYVEKTFGMVLEIYKTADATVPIYKKLLTECDELGFYHESVKNVKDGMYYVWRMVDEDYSYSPAIMDPYSKATYFIYGEWRNLVMSDRNYLMPKPRIQWEQTVIYELHVGHFTKRDLSCPEEERGTFKGLIRKLPYLKQLGVTTLELLPIFKWYPNTLKTISPVTGKLLEDVWGYNTLAFFAVDERFSVERTSEASLNELRQLIEIAHKMEMEIVLDVVYNHSGEGGKDGAIIHFKRLAPHVYYKYNDNGEYLNCSGCGNTINTNHPLVKRLIKESLLYWAEQVGVDGFRFDLASILGQDEKGHWLKESLLNEIGNDPVLSQVKLITESWDAKGSYDVGRMPAPFSEWSDYFRDTMRKFVKGDQGMIQAVVDCMLGKEIYFTDSNSKQKRPIHFITAHDGFTMRDLVSYNHKHNEANGENNRDGHNGNYSYNWGVEGETEEIEIIKQRKRILRNLYGMLLLSKGTPMLLMGDEMGRSQQGNNNAFCQDNEIVWVNWQEREKYQDLTHFVTSLIALRKRLGYFNGKGEYEVSWHGIHFNQPDLSYYSRSIACYIKGEESLFIIANSYCEALQFELPPIDEANKWYKILDTAMNEAFMNEEILQNIMTVEAYSICVLKKE